MDFTPIYTRSALSILFFKYSKQEDDLLGILYCLNLNKKAFMFVITRYTLLATDEEYFLFGT